jgi:hypothetical protein
VEGGADALAQISRPTHGGGGGVPASSETTSRGRRGHGRPAPDFYVVSLRKKKKEKRNIALVTNVASLYDVYILQKCNNRRSRGTCLEFGREISVICGVKRNVVITAIFKILNVD